MKKLILALLPVLVLSFGCLQAGPADQPVRTTKSSSSDPFTQIANSPNGYWVPAPTPRPVVYYPPPPGYYGPYGPPPPYYGPPPVYYGPPLFIGFGFGFHGHR